MKLPYSQPNPTGSERARRAKAYRNLATEVSRLVPQALTRTNGEETDHEPQYPANFTKGLRHDEYGILADPSDYRCFVEAINSPQRTLFETRVNSSVEAGTKFHCNVGNGTAWRGWESPRAGHCFDLEGPDMGAVGMAPAPRVGSSELAAEMAEVYALAILRDVPFTTICTGGSTRLCSSCKEAGVAELSAREIVQCLNGMPFYSGQNICSSTPHMVDSTGLNSFERNRRFARTLSHNGILTPKIAFRGSTKGAQVGPYISQFMLIGANSLAGRCNGAAAFPANRAHWAIQSGFIPYGTVSIDQRTLTQKTCLDYMTDWCSWLDVQNGADFTGLDVFEKDRRFITTPRDLATYVHFDALYEAYLNACLILLGMQVPVSRGFPEPSPSRKRDAFATFGGPHILSLVCEVATRCLKAVRRQKFNYHRRARPEAIGGRLTLARLEMSSRLGGAGDAFERMLAEIPCQILSGISSHNATQNEQSIAKIRRLQCPTDCRPGEVESDTLAQCNLLLPMAFPEGSPMHPAYGAGHATVAGGCVTMLKAFFEMFTDRDGGVERPLVDAGGNAIAYVPNQSGTQLVAACDEDVELSIQGELDKLAANISIGRNMAGVHYYSDYYDSLRMGERIAVGILMEQAPSYGDAVESTFKSFDGDQITITGEAGSFPSLSIMDRAGVSLHPEQWWLRHVSGREVRDDLH